MKTKIGVTLGWPQVVGAYITANSGVTFGSGQLTEAKRNVAAWVVAPVEAGYKWLMQSLRTGVGSQLIEMYRQCADLLAEIKTLHQD